MKCNVHEDAWDTYIAVALYMVHSSLRLYEGLRISIFSDLGAVDPLRFLSDLAFPIAAGLSLVAHSPDLHLQPGARAITYLHIYYIVNCFLLLLFFVVV